MFNKLKQIIKQYKCNHYMELSRWHWVHFPNHEPASIEVEYKCSLCGKVSYIYLYSEEAKEWVKVMEDYKKG